MGRRLNIPSVSSVVTAMLLAGCYSAESVFSSVCTAELQNKSSKYEIVQKKTITLQHHVRPEVNRLQIHNLKHYHQL